MTFTDPIGDMFSRIRNGQMRSLNSVEIPSSNFRKNILEILKNEGYIKDLHSNVSVDYVTQQEVQKAKSLWEKAVNHVKLAEAPNDPPLLNCICVSEPAGLPPPPPKSAID